MTATNTSPSRSLTRREFLNYVWLASMALLMAKAGSMTWMFASPRDQSAHMHAIIALADVPAVDQPPALVRVPINPDADLRPRDHIHAPVHYSIYLSNTSEGLFAFLNRCTHRGCIFPWSEAAGIFACPCHGSQFERAGTWIAGPVPRDLDRFPITALDDKGDVLAAADQGQALVVPAGTAALKVDYSQVIRGRNHP